MAENPTITNNFPVSESHFTSEDRKAIYRLEFNHEQFSKDVKEIKSDVKEIKEGLSSRVAATELSLISLNGEIKATDKRSDDRYVENKDRGIDHESRLRSLENWRYIIVGAIALLAFLLANNFLHLIK